MTMVCRICSNQAENKSYKVREMMYGTREIFTYFECAECGCLQIADIPEDMDAHYPSSYYSFQPYDGGKFKGTKGGLKKRFYSSRILGKNFLHRLMGTFAGSAIYDCLKDVELNKNTRILDVGCGNGRNFLYPLAEIGFTNLLGIDPFIPNDIDYDNGLKVAAQSIDDVSGTWDVITYHHAFEHLPDPQHHLEILHGLLSEKGVLIIRIPTASSFAWEHFRENWVQLDAPRHFFLHTRESMSRIATEAGLDLFNVEYDSTDFQFTGSINYQNDIPLNTPKEKGLLKKLKRKLASFQYGEKARRLNQQGKGDQAIFYLRPIKT